MERIRTSSMEGDKEGNVFVAAVWMFILSAVLFWLPVVGGLIAGFVGGRKAGSVGGAIIAALIPAILVGVLIYFLGAGLADAPVIGFIAGLGGFVYMLSQIIPLLIGAGIGGYMT